MKKHAFTLAEVLITLTIIGVIAALTIPNLIQKWQDHADVQKVKVAYSILSNAVKMADAESGPLTEVAWPSNSISGNSLTLSNYLKPYLKVRKDCGTSIQNCLYGWKNGKLDKTSGSLKDFAGTVSSYPYRTVDYAEAAVTLENGMTFLYMASYAYNKAQVFVNVDINGGTIPPNRIGYDIFCFTIVPANYSQNVPSVVVMAGQLGYYSIVAQSLGTKGATFKMETVDSCKDRAGKGCADWVLKHGNMDYKYRDVSAEW